MEDSVFHLNSYFLDNDFTEEFLSRDISEIPGYAILTYFYVL